MTVWFIARGAGLAALVLLTAATCLGAVTSRRARPARRYLLQYAHRACAGLGLAALTLHLGTILADADANVGWAGALVPLASGYRPVAVALGTVAGYLFVAVAVLGAARGRLAGSPRAARAWRAIHALSYAGWAAAMLHGLRAGTDASAGWVHGLFLACLVAVIASLAVRLADRYAAPGPARVKGILR